MEVFMRKQKTIRLADNVKTRELLVKGFFYHKNTNDFWLLLNPTTSFKNNVEISIRASTQTKEVKLYVTNDHLKLPSIYNKRFNKDNYLEFEDEIDQYSFADAISLLPIVELMLDGILVVK
jgi:hypothetical protein